MKPLISLSALGLVLALSPRPAEAETRGLVAVRAGTIHVVEDGSVLHDATLLVRDGKIVAVGEDVAIPRDARIVDYGDDAVIIPGLVAAYSSYATGRPSRRTAEPGLRAIDGFDFFSENATAISSGVTSMYLTPAENRLISGAGALVKVAGDDRDGRILREVAAVHGAIDDSARNTSGYWQPPIPATVDVGMGFAEAQLPRTTMGAIVALREILAAARSGAGDTVYGPHLPVELGPLVEAGLPWRISAVEESEIRALLSFANEAEVPLIVDRAWGADGLVDELREAGASVVFHLPFDPNQPGRDHGRSRDALWPSFDVPAALAEAGVPFAIASSSVRDVLFAASVSSRAGLSPEAALRAVTLTPAEIYGAADRVGSLAPGKDADFVVLGGPPIGAGAGVLSTWIDGGEVWSPERQAAAGKKKGAGRAARGSRAVVLAVDELHVGDGTVLRPGQILLMDGKIAEVGSGVARPGGAAVVSGKVAMPGMIDALGHLGLEGSEKVPNADFRMRSIVAPGDRVDRRVAAAGVTTVVLSPRGTVKSGAPVMAYKPAAQSFDGLVVGDPVALRMRWSERDRLESGDQVRELLEDAREYRQEWLDYQSALADWEPGPEEADDDGDEEEGDEEEGEGENGDEDGNGKDDDKKDKKKKKKKGDDEEELEPDPITGVWQAELARPPRAEPAVFKMRLSLVPKEGSGEVTGNLRCEAVSDELVDVEGYWDRETLDLDLTGLGTQGWIAVQATLEEGKLAGGVEVGGTRLELAAERTSKDYVVAGRPERRRAESEREPKGKPKMPKLDEKLEPLRAAMEDRATVIVEVARRDEILACVDAFESFGIRPVLHGAEGIEEVLADLRGRVAGVLLPPAIVVREAERGTDVRTPYSEVQGAGIPVAFHSDAEEGAVDLPLMATYAVARGMSSAGALRALTSDAAEMMAIDDRVGRLEVGLDADVLLLDGPPLAPGTSVLRAWVNGVEVEVGR